MASRLAAFQKRAEEFAKHGNAKVGSMRTAQPQILDLADRAMYTRKTSGLMPLA